MFFRKKLNQPFIIENVCQQAHSLVEKLTDNLQVPEAHEADKIRKKTAMFVFGIVSGYAQHEKLEPSPVYQAYLQLMGGLDKQQAFAAVERAQKRIDHFDEAKSIYLQGIQFANSWMQTQQFNRQPFLNAVGIEDSSSS